MAGPGSYTQFSVATRHSAGVEQVVVAGELDRATGPRLAAVLHERLSGRRRVVLDLSAVTFMDAGGVEAVWVAAREAAAFGADLGVRPGAGGAAAARTLELTGMTRYVTLVD
jgi:stage II sporulation protein AA (anti-sigma F factor antagonist)